MTHAIEYLPDPYTFIDKPMPWHLAGLTWTATGYGARIPSRRMVVLPDGRKRRVYITQYSNAGSAWITLNGRRVYLRG